MGSLFGGSKSKSVSTPVDKTPAEFQALRGPFAATLRQLFQGSPDSVFNIPTSPAAQSGEMVAPITQNETAILEQLFNEGGTRRGLIEDTLSGKFLPGQAGSNPFLQAAIEAAQRPTLEGLTETLTRALPGRFTSAGQFIQPRGSSAFDRAAAIATRGAANAMADIATNLSFGVHEAERGRQQSAIQLGQQEVETTVKNLQAQALPRLIQDLGIERGLEEFRTRMAAMIDLMRTMAGVTSPNIATQTVSTGETKPNIAATLGGIAFGGSGAFPGGL